MTKSAEDIFREFLSAKELNTLELVFSNRSLDDAVKEFFLMQLSDRTVKGTNPKVCTRSSTVSSSGQ